MELTLPVVRVDWVDSAMEESWTKFEELKGGKVMLCHSFGVLLHEDSEMLVIAPHIGYDPLQATGTMYIPKRCVTKVVEMMPKEGAQCDTANTST